MFAPRLNELVLYARLPSNLCLAPSPTRSRITVAMQRFDRISATMETSIVELMTRYLVHSAVRDLIAMAWPTRNNSNGGRIDTRLSTLNCQLFSNLHRQILIDIDDLLLL